MIGAPHAGGELLLRVGQKRRIYIPEEISIHNSVDDLWVAALGHVYDLTQLVKESMGPLAKPLIEQAGKDISFLFDAKTGDPKTWIEPVTNLSQYYLPCGRFLHVPPSGPVTNWQMLEEEPWWRSDKYRIGKLTQKTRRLSIVNTLTKKEDVLTVGSEETISEIQDRYQEYNSHAGSYTWKKLENVKIDSYVGCYSMGTGTGFVHLDMFMSLSENGIMDEGEDLEELGIDKDLYLPVVHIYFNDDLTVT